MSSLNDIDADNEISKLERLAFKGSWDTAEQGRVWKAFGLDKMTSKEVAEDQNHSRFNHLAAICTLFGSYNNEKKIDPLLFDITKRYVERYPSCRQYIPGRVLSAICPETIGGSTDWQRGITK